MNIININKNHYEHIFDLLSELTISPKLNYNNYINIIDKLTENHMIYVYEIDNIPVGIITLIIEQKLIHDGKCVGHIEDLVVNNNYKGKGIATKLLNYCINKCKDKNCYKIILDCKDELKLFYNKNNFLQQGITMRLDL